MDETLQDETFTWTDEHEKQLDALWEADPVKKPSLKELTRTLFDDDTLDGRSVQARCVQQALARKGRKAKTTKNYERKTDQIELSEAHKRYIENNQVSMNGLEMAHEIFHNPNLSNLDAETRAVHKYLKSLNPRNDNSQAATNAVALSDWTSPKTFDETLKRINKYVSYCQDREEIKATEKKNIERLNEYLRTLRLIAQINTFETIRDREVFEDAFIRATYDKPDLAQEEVDQYIEYANTVVEGFKIQRRKEVMLRQQEEMAANSDPDSRKYSIHLVEAIGKASNEYDQIKRREQKLLDDLKQKRSVRLSKQLNENASILNLVQAWKQEETRLELLRHAEKEQAAVKEEVARLSDMSELKARILGLSKEAILNG